jgi:hypothetical protein
VRINPLRFNGLIVSEDDDATGIVQVAPPLPFGRPVQHPRGEETMTIRTNLKAGKLAANHNEALQIRSALKAGRLVANHSQALQVRTAVRAGGIWQNHNEALRVRTELKAGKRRI